MGDYSYLRFELLWTVLPYAAPLLGSSVLAWYVGRWVFRRRPRWQELKSGECGSAMMEFTLAFPVFVLIVMVVMQLALMLNAALVVDYAAFCAARSASVWIPVDLNDENGNRKEGANEIKKGGFKTRLCLGKEKWGRIHRAAAIACAPLSPRAAEIADLYGGGWNPTPFGDGQGPFQNLKNFAPNIELPDLGGDFPTEVIGDVLKKLPYSCFFTEIAIDGVEDSSQPATIDANGSIRVTVTHKFELGVPLAGNILKNVFDGENYGGTIGSFIGTAHYAPISSTYTMMNWGAYEARPLSTGGSNSGSSS